LKNGGRGKSVEMHVYAKVVMVLVSEEGQPADDWTRFEEWRQFGISEITIWSQAVKNDKYYLR
jgi:hypothetical protein